MVKIYISIVYTRLLNLPWVRSIKSYHPTLGYLIGVNEACLKQCKIDNNKSVIAELSFRI